GGEAVRLRSLVANAVAASIECPPLRTYFPHYYDRIEEFRKETPVNNKDIVFLGNSLIENGNWSELLHKNLIRNRGIIGDEAMGIYDRLYQILPGKPKKIFLQTGANDVSHDLSTDTIVHRITMIIDKIRTESPETKLYLQSMLPINESFGKYKKLTGKTDMIPAINSRLQSIAETKEIPFINLYPLFIEPGTNILRKDLTSDGLHLEESGYEIWAKALKPYI
ncbi:hypothetical protein EZS27_018819, partial [termite gut metagenome]